MARNAPSARLAPSRLRRRARGILVVVLFVLPLAISVTGNSTGRQGNTVYDHQGCICHSPNPNQGTQPSLQGVPQTYEPGTRYTLQLSSTTDVLGNPLGNQGGFFAYVSGGTLAPADGASPWYRTGRLNASQSYVEHDLQGAHDNRQQKWSFVWTSPKPGVGPVVLGVFVNRVNGDGNATTDDHWNRLSRTVAGPNEVSTVSSAASVSRTVTPSTMAPSVPARPAGSPARHASPAAAFDASVLAFAAAAFLGGTGARRPPRDRPGRPRPPS